MLVYIPLRLVNLAMQNQDLPIGAIPLCNFCSSQSICTKLAAVRLCCRDLVAMAGLACGSNLLVGVPQWAPPAALASSQGQLVMSHNAICLRNKAAGSALLSRCVCKFFLCEVEVIGQVVRFTVFLIVFLNLSTYAKNSHQVASLPWLVRLYMWI